MYRSQSADGSVKQTMGRRGRTKEQGEQGEVQEQEQEERETRRSVGEFQQFKQSYGVELQKSVTDGSLHRKRCRG